MPAFSLAAHREVCLQSLELFVMILLLRVRRWELEPLRGPCNSYLTARKELGILLHLDHANIVPLLGICLHPTSLVLSLAPLGALNGLLKDYKRSGVRLSLKALQRIVLQVAQVRQTADVVSVVVISVSE